MALAMIEGAERRGARVAARPDRGRVHGRLDGELVGVRVRGQGVPVAHRQLEHVLGREVADDGSVRRRARHHRQPAGDPPRLDRADGRPVEGDRRRDRWGLFHRPVQQPRRARRLPRDRCRDDFEQLDQPIQSWCAYVGVGGCFVAVGEVLRSRWSDVAGQQVAVEPAESAGISGEPAGTHRIEGGGVGFIPPHLTPDTYEARREGLDHGQRSRSARRAATEEGVWTGPSGGANLVGAALRLARELGPGSRVVTIQPDSGLKYLGGDLYG